MFDDPAVFAQAGAVWLAAAAMWAYAELADLVTVFVVVVAAVGVEGQGSSAGPATAATYRWDRVDQLSGTCGSPPRSLNSPEQSDPAQGREPTVPIDELTQLRHPSCGATARAYA